MSKILSSEHPRTPMDYQRFFANQPKNNEKKEITISHITIRQSISILLFRLVVLELFAAAFLIAFHTIFFTIDLQLPDGISLFNIPIFLALVAVKTFLMLYITLEWLDEHYEITTKEIIHRRGFIFKHEDRHALTHLVSLRIYQGVIGKFFNFGSIILFNWAKNKDISIYLIHNPKKYARILENLLPESDEEKNTIREKIIEDTD